MDPSVDNKKMDFRNFLRLVGCEDRELVPFTDVKIQLRKKLKLYNKPKSGSIHYHVGRQSFGSLSEYSLVLSIVGGLLEPGKFFMATTGVDPEELFAYAESLGADDELIADDFAAVVKNNAAEGVKKIIAGRLVGNSWEEPAYRSMGFTVQHEDAVGKFLAKPEYKPGFPHFVKMAQKIVSEFKETVEQATPQEEQQPDEPEGEYHETGTENVATLQKDPKVGAEVIQRRYDVSNRSMSGLGRCMSEKAMNVNEFVSFFHKNARNLIPELTREDALILLQQRRGQLTMLAGGMVRFSPKKNGKKKAAKLKEEEED